MLRTSVVPPGPGVAGLPAASEMACLNEILRLQPGARREQAILRVVASLSASLTALHDAGRTHGGICPDALAHDVDGSVALAPPSAATPDDEDAIRHVGYAAFEQYTDDPDRPCGPWTDVYGLAALAYFLATGAAPPSALARRVRDDYLPLDDWEPGAYRAAFCAAVDNGLALEAQARPQTVVALALEIGVSPPAAQVPVADDPEPEPEPEPEPDLAAPSLMAEAATEQAAETLPAAVRLTAMRPEHPARRRRVLPLVAAVLLLLAAGGYAWLRPATQSVELAAGMQRQSEPPSQPPPPQSEPQPESQPHSPPQAASAAPAPTPKAQPDPPVVLQPASSPQTAAGGPQTPPAGSGPEIAPAPGPAPAPATSEPAAPATQPSQAPVTVRVAVRPWGEVLVNGRSRGVSPPLRELSLPPGRYQVTVRNASAGDHRMTLTVASGRPASITHEFK